ncbi:hypothetical protein JHS3_12960 [Jeongeupia sp. HS-3]|uniref:DUF4434 domain-containing protein n=1 Tax=Jeongeupia sp. HS-3 TaxID=1009682 RepID=UPI0018A358A4|nr:DUF4434 domain-containing protein [Jeongeupia sp. HS-3]BCL75560.1 hypothetical protein JHS3_12960 [Jeongeupia sp. HS-3]
MRLARFLLLFILGLPAVAQAMTAIIYQPQLRDRDVVPEHWSHIFRTTRAQGFDTLVVQWTRHGDGFSEQADRAWLAARLSDARAAGLQLVIGLSADPDFFIRQQHPARVLDGYFRRTKQADATLARQWLETLGANAISGWYLSAEIDDVRWREPDARDSLIRYLRSAATQLQSVANKPVYMTSFFAGNMAPKSYAALLGQLERASGVRLWVQDGAGTGKLNVAERQLYLDAVSDVGNDCSATTAHGVVYELFRQVGDDTAFRAETRPLDEARRILTKRAACGGDSVFFSLRYLPALNGVLPY